MAHLADLMNETVSLTISIDSNNEDNKAHIVYRPNAYSGRVEAAMKDIDPQREPNRAFREAICMLVDSWDLKWHESDDEPLPLDVDELIDVPTNVLIGIVSRITKDIETRSPKHRTSKRSNTH